MQTRTSLYIIGLAIYATFIPLAIIKDLSGFIPDLIIFSTVLTFIYFNWNSFKITKQIFTLIILSQALHACGIFGWYGSSPLPIDWDHITHLVGLFSFSLLFFRFIEQFTDSTFTKKNILLYTLAILAASGVGAVIELAEFAGYLKFGFGEGALAFGPGDGAAGTFTTDTDGLINNLGGGWINTGWDLIYNTIGITAGLIATLTNNFFRKKPQKAYYFETVENFSKKI